jgi:hypothetical protein
MEAASRACSTCSKASERVDRFEIPPGVTVEYLTKLVPGSRVRMTEGAPGARNSSRGLSSLELAGRRSYGLYSVEEVEACDAPVWAQGSAIGARYLLDRRPVAYTCGKRPHWPSDGANASMGHWVLMARTSHS